MSFVIQVLFEMLKFWVFLRSHCKQFLSVKLIKNPPSTLGGNKKKKTRNDSNHSRIPDQFHKQKPLWVTSWKPKFFEKYTFRIIL